MLFLRADLSQAEDRIVKVLSHNKELIDLARRKPWEFDVHKYNAALIFQVEEKDVTKMQRQAGKRIVHASNYDAQPQRVSDALLDEGFIIPVEECAKRQEVYHNRFPAIRRSYQLRTRMMVLREGKLTNSWGFSIAFPYERRDNALWRRCYAWRAQSEIGFLLNQKGVIPAYEWIRLHDYRARIRFQVHDEIAIAIADLGEAWSLAQLLRDSLEGERDYEGELLSIPADFALERRYHGKGDDAIEWKRFPEHGEFKDAFDKLNRN